MCCLIVCLKNEHLLLHSIYTRFSLRFFVMNAPIQCASKCSAPFIYTKKHDVCTPCFSINLAYEKKNVDSLAPKEFNLI